MWKSHHKVDHVPNDGKRQHIPMVALLGNYLDLLHKDIDSQEKTRPTLDSLSIMSHIP